MAPPLTRNNPLSNPQSTGGGIKNLKAMGQGLIGPTPLISPPPHNLLLNSHHAHGATKSNNMHQLPSQQMHFNPTKLMSHYNTQNLNNNSS